jgi:(p)ppGpp synthase/HD superfamily hydrolase
MSIYEKAKNCAIEAHGSINQVRKYTNEPYHVHVLAVAELVSTKTNDEEVLAAACLHDVLEDVAPFMSQYGKDFIRAEFGDRVLSIVEELTDIYTKENYPDLNRKKRKALEADRLSKVSEEAKLIKRADIFDNNKTLMGTSFEKVWLEEKAVLGSLIGTWE